jgi:hypothetical protein
MRRQNQKEMVEWRALASPIVSAWERETLCHILFFKWKIFFSSLSLAVCVGPFCYLQNICPWISIQFSRRRLRLCVNVLSLFIFLFFKRCSGWLLFSRYCTFITKKKVLAMKEWGGWLLFLDTLLFISIQRWVIYCAARNVLFRVDVIIYGPCQISSFRHIVAPTHTPTTKKAGRKNVLGIKFNGDSSVCTQVRCQVRHTHAIRIVCLIVWIFIYTSILYTVTSLPADDNGE